MNDDMTTYSEKRVCDGCTNPLEPGSHVVHYSCDTIWVGNERSDLPKVDSQEMYCLDCYTDSIPIPHKGTNEVFSLITIEELNSGEYTYNHHQNIKTSPDTQGISWEPLHVLDKYHIMPTEKINFPITPMYVFSVFRRSGVDLRGFISDNSLEIPTEQEQQLKKLVDISINRFEGTPFHPDLM